MSIGKRSRLAIYPELDEAPLNAKHPSCCYFAEWHLRCLSTPEVRPVCRIAAPFRFLLMYLTPFGQQRRHGIWRWHGCCIIYESTSFTSHSAIPPSQVTWHFSLLHIQMHCSECLGCETRSDIANLRKTRSVDMTMNGINNITGYQLV